MTAAIISLLLLVATPAISQSGPAVSLEIRLAAHEVVVGWDEAKLAGTDRVVYLAPEPAITNDDVAKAWLDTSGPEIGVGLLMTDDGSLRLARLTKAHLGEHVAFVIDGQVVSMPKIGGQISRRALIYGRFSEDRAREIAEALDPSND